MLEFRPLHPLFASEVIGLDLTRLVSDEDFARVEAAFRERSVLVFRDVAVTDAQQIAFSERFGALETTKVGTPGAGSPLVVLRNFDDNGEIAPQSDRQLLNNKANRHWHADSSFKRVSAKASMLSARIVPSHGGNTEYLSMRAAYAALPDATKVRIDGLVAIHDYAYGRAKIAPDLVTAEERDAVPPVRQALVLDHGAQGKSLYLGAHCASIEGLPDAEARALIDDLMTHADQDAFRYSHPWRPYDLILWDNRSVLHRATPFASQTEKRLMVRTTIAGDAPTL